MLGQKTLVNVRSVLTMVLVGLIAANGCGPAKVPVSDSQQARSLAEKLRRIGICAGFTRRNSANPANATGTEAAARRRKSSSTANSTTGAIRG